MPAINLVQQMKDILTDYSDEVMHATIKALEETAKEAADELKAKSPKRTGKYARDWAVKSEAKRTYTSTFVYNKKHYQLTHLLEYGHAKYEGGRRVEGEFGKVEHIGPVNENAEKLAVKNITEAIQRIK